MRDQNQDGNVADQAEPVIPLNLEQGDQIIGELASLTEMVERQGGQQQRILVGIFNRLDRTSLADGQVTDFPEKGKEVISGIETEGRKGENREKEGFKRDEKGKSDQSPRSLKRPKLAESTPKREIEVKQGNSVTEKGKSAPPEPRPVPLPPRAKTTSPDTVTASQARERRTITLGEESVATTAEVVQPVVQIVQPALSLPGESATTTTPDAPLGQGVQPTQLGAQPLAIPAAQVLQPAQPIGQVASAEPATQPTQQIYQGASPEPVAERPEQSITVSVSVEPAAHAQSVATGEPGPRQGAPVVSVEQAADQPAPSIDQVVQPAPAAQLAAQGKPGAEGKPGAQSVAPVQVAQVLQPAVVPAPAVAPARQSAASAPVTPQAADQGETPEPVSQQPLQAQATETQQTQPPQQAQHHQQDQSVLVESVANLVEQGSQQAEQGALAAPQTKRDKPAEPERAGGFYLGSDGKVRRPDGTFANKVEARRFTKARNKDADEEKGAGNPSLLAKAIGLLGSKNGSDLADTETVDSAGVAMGNTFWLAAKEVKGMADEVKDALADREINSAKDAKAYAKNKLDQVWGAITRPFGKRATEEAGTAGSQAEFRQEAQEAKQAAEQQKEQATAEEQHNEVVERLDALIDASKPQSKGLIDMAADSLGERMERGKGRNGRRAGRGGGRGGRRAATSTRGRSGRANSVADVADLADGPRSRRQPGRTGRLPNIERATLPGAGGAGGAARATAGRAGRLSRVAARMPAIGAPLASVASVGGMAGGALSAAPGAIATAGRGAMALGGRAVPLIGAAMAAYDAYTGFTDEEGQRRVFGLEQAADPTLGQKAAMGAGRVLDLGGLTSGLSGLLADGAGALGMKNLQESLTFDSDDLAKGLYGAFSNDQALSAMGVKEGESGSLGQNVVANVARAVNMGGVVSGTASLLGGIAEDLGFDGAKKALTFDTSDLAESLYDFFGPILGDDKDKGRERVVINNSTARYETTSARQGITEAEVTKAGKQYDFSALEQANGLPAGYMNAVAGVESGGNPLAYNKSGAKGMFQLMPKTAAALGVSDPYNVQQAAAGAAKLTVDNARYFNKTMGRSAEGRELYLLHQQGMGGGTALLQNPNMSAAEALTRGGQKNAAEAIQQNGGNLNMSAQEFADMIMAKYDRQFMAQTIATERGAQAKPLERAVDETVKGVKNTPDYLLRTPAPVQKSAQAVPEPKGWSGVMDIQHEQARAAATNPGDAEITAKMDPRMTSVMEKLDKTLNGMKPGTAQKAPGSSTTTHNNTTNNYFGQARGVGDHEYVRWPNSDKG